MKTKNEEVALLDLLHEAYDQHDTLYAVEVFRLLKARHNFLVGTGQFKCAQDLAGKALILSKQYFPDQSTLVWGWRKLLLKATERANKQNAVYEVMSFEGSTKA